MSFLKAEWRKLAIANYVIDPKILSEYIPYGTELDLWENKCYVSLVGFKFLNTKILGVKIPYHTNFEEVNLRFYVRYKDNNEWKRGVVFIKEIVPRRALTFVANNIYAENYETMKMSHNWVINDEEQIIKYEWINCKEKHHLKVISELDTRLIDVGSEEEFITEHYWGYTKVNNSTTFEYEVTHPRWEYYPIKNFEVNVNFDSLYGNDFKILNQEKPKSLMLMEGSQITVENKRRI